MAKKNAQQNSAKKTAKFQNIGRDLKALSSKEAQFNPEAMDLEISVPEVKIEVAQQGISFIRSLGEKLKAGKVAVRDKVQKQLTNVKNFLVWMREVALPFIGEVEKYVEDADVGSEILKLPFEGSEEGKPMTIGEKSDEYRKRINGLANNQNPLAQIPVRATELIFWLKFKPLTRDELMQLVDEGVKAQILEKSKDGSIPTFFQERYRIAPRLDSLEEPLKSALKTELKAAIEDQVSRIKKGRADEVKTRAAEFAAESEMKVLEIISTAKTGMCAVMVSDGALKLQVSDIIEMLDATGRPENGFTDLKDLEAKYRATDLKIAIPRKSLLNKDGQLANPNEVPEFKAPAEIKNGGDRYQFSASSKFLWHVTRDAIEVAAREVPKPRKVKEATGNPDEQISADDFHHKNRLGQYLVELAKWIWKFPDPATGKINGDEPVEVTNLKLHFQRFRDEKDRVRLRLVDFSQEHFDFLDKVGCLSPDGYLDNVRLPFFNLTLKADHANKFPRDGAVAAVKPEEQKKAPAKVAPTETTETKVETPVQETVVAKPAKAKKAAKKPASDKPAKKKTAKKTAGKAKV